MNELKKQKRWVLWMAEEVNGRMTKVPYTVKGRRASSTKAADWSTYAECKKALANFGTGIGIIFTEEQTLVGIDIDHVLEGMVLPDAIDDFVGRAKTLTEISPSGTGLHLYLRIDEPFIPEGNKHAPFEIYTKGRFFTFTENIYGGRRPLRTISRADLDALLETIGYPWKKAAEPNAAAILDATPHYFNNDELKRAMFGSKNGEKIRMLWMGDATAYGGDVSRADAALLNHLAFWSGKDAAQMEALWLESELGHREKTRKRADYRLRSIEGAIATTKDVYKPADAGLDLLFTTAASGGKIITTNLENICRVLRGHAEFAGRLRLDEFSSIIEIRDERGWRPFQDSDALDIQARISILFQVFQKVKKDMVYDAILKVMQENAYDSGKEFIASLKWDGKARLDSWLANTFGVSDDDYHHAVASNWLKGLVKRVMEPGCKFDYVLVLEGEQGAKKSTSLYVLGQMIGGKSWHVETTMSTDSKDFFMQMQGKAIIEFSEGETLSRTEVKKMKAIITMQSDKYRPPYSRTSQDFPRRCVFAMTTNQDEYLKDETGNRRWLPVRVVFKKADIEWLSANRDQIVAEAWARVKKGETLHEFPEERTRDEQEARRVTSPNEERIADWYYRLPPSTREEGITTYHAYIGAINQFPNAVMKKFEEMEIGDIFRRVLKLEKRRKMVNNVYAMRWFDDKKLAPAYDPTALENAFNDHGGL